MNTVGGDSLLDTALNQWLFVKAGIGRTVCTYEANKAKLLEISMVGKKGLFQGY